MLKYKLTNGWKLITVFMLINFNIYKIIVEKYIENIDGDIYYYLVLYLDWEVESIMFVKYRKRSLKKLF